MSTDRDTTRIVRSWLEEGVTALPDRVLDAVLDQLPATSQRRPWWPARRFREMNNALKLAIAAAAVVVVALVGINLMPGSGRHRRSRAKPDADARRDSVADARRLRRASVRRRTSMPGEYVHGTTVCARWRPRPGTYSIPAVLRPGRITFTDPAAGWSHRWKRFASAGSPRRWPTTSSSCIVTSLIVDTRLHRYLPMERDARGSTGSDRRSTTSSASLVAQGRAGASPPVTDVELGGYPAKTDRTDRTRPTSMSRTCDSGESGGVHAKFWPDSRPWTRAGGHLHAVRHGFRPTSCTSSTSTARAQAVDARHLPGSVGGGHRRTGCDRRLDQDRCAATQSVALPVIRYGVRR